MALAIGGSGIAFPFKSLSSTFSVAIVSTVSAFRIRLRCSAPKFIGPPLA